MDFPQHLQPLLSAAEKPLLRLVLWPFSDRRLWIDSLCLDPPGSGASGPSIDADAPSLEEDTKLRIDPSWKMPSGASLSKTLIDQAYDQGVRRIVVGQAHDLSADALEEVSNEIPSSLQLVLITNRIDNWAHLPIDTVLPHQACLDFEQMEHVLGSPEAALEAARLTEGWTGPVFWLAAQKLRPDAYEQALNGDAFRREFERRVLQGLPPLKRHTLVGLALARTLGLDDWRQMVVDQPDQLAAFEQILRRDGWLLPGRDGWRLPTLMASQLLASNGGARSHSRLRKELERARASEFSNQSELKTGFLRKRKPSDLQSVVSKAKVEAHLHLLGRARLVRGIGSDRREVVWRLKRSLRCVAYLALAPERARSKEGMIEHLWHDQPPEAALRNFHPTLSEARKTLGHADTIVYRQGAYALGDHLDLILDVDELSAYVKKADELLTSDHHFSADKSIRRQALECFCSAWRLYGGPLLEGFEDEWLQEPRSRFNDVYLNALRSVAGLASGLDRTQLALDAYRSLLVTEPFDEEAHVGVMHIYGRQGRRDLVRRQFVCLQDRLKELHVEPSTAAVSTYNLWMR